MTNQINRVAIVGGTHGNELIGAYLIQKFQRSPALIQRSSFETIALLGNPKAFEAKRRYIDKDLNRCFTHAVLQQPSALLYEEKRAGVINQKLGPKGNAQVDFIIDLHSTSANMGLTGIPVNNHSFNLNILAYLSAIEPDLKIYSWIEPGQESSFLNSICDRGFAIEVGPITPGILDATLFQSTERLIHAILDYLHDFNQGNALHHPASLLIHRHLSTVDFPKRDTGELNGMIHRDRQGQDYQELRPGDPLFTTFNGEAIVYTGSSSVYPVFINEAAYYEKGIAMCLTQKETIDITSLHL